MKTLIAKPTTLSLALGLIFCTVVATASADTVMPGAYDTAAQKGSLTETGYSRGGYATRILLDEGYHDWTGKSVAQSESTGILEKAEFAAFEESYDVPWEITGID